MTKRPTDSNGTSRGTETTTTVAPARDETFHVEDGYLIRRVVPRRGQPYEHRCPRKAIEQVAAAIDEAGDAPFTLESLVQREDLPFTQVAVALAFLKERGIVETRYRRNYAATQCAHLDAMTEFFALAENG
jgi:predicted Rossmann fold nucleotide-binding protein DprA/Smf involved in DNA uptake